MRIVSLRLKIWVIATILLNTLPATASGETLRGRVIDDGMFTEPKSAGIPGVTINVFKKDKPLLSEPEITNAKGEYQIKGLPGGVPLKVHYQKIGYVKYPTIVEINLKPKQTQEPVKLVLQSASADYYIKRSEERRVGKECRL